MSSPTFSLPSSTDEPIACRRLGFVEFSLAEELMRLAVYWLTGYGMDIVAEDGETPASMEFECHTNLAWPLRAPPRGSKGGPRIAGTPHFNS